MPTKNKFQFVLVILAVLNLCACSSSSEVKVNQELSRQINHDAVVELMVEVSLEQDADEDEQTEAREMVSRLRGALFERLVYEGVFKEAFHNGQDGLADYFMNVKLKESDEVSQGARIFWGVLAGSNELVAQITLKDLYTGELLTDFVVTGKSASHPLSSESGIDDAIRELVDQVIFKLNQS